MNQFEHYIVALLQNRITNVYVTKHFSEAPKLPCITLDLGNGVTTEQVERIVTQREYLCYTRKAEININLWCNTELERQDLTNQILDLFYLEQSNHYTYCNNYQDSHCLMLSKTCPASVTSTNYKILKGKCPDPKKYQYKSLSESYGLIPGTVNIEPPFELDELNHNPPLLRSVFKAEAAYQEYVTVGGHRVDTVNLGEDEFIIVNSSITKED